MQCNLLDLEDSQGSDQGEIASHWLQDLGATLLDVGEDVQLWRVAEDDVLAPWDEELVRAGAEKTAWGRVALRRVRGSRFPSTIVHGHLLPRLERFGEVGVLGHGLRSASTLVAIDQLLRAAGVRGAALLLWLAPTSLGPDAAFDAVDWGNLKRACSIVAPNSHVWQQLTARRVGSMVIERGSEAARWFVSEHVRRPRAPRRIDVAMS